MASASSSTETASASTATAAEERKREEALTAAAEERKRDEATEMVHKTKLIQFLGRTTPIILQNDNGPCPLLAICNVLLLRNSLNLSPDIPEVSQEKLLSLVAERLIDSNSNVNNKDDGYVENQQQNIADAIDLLPRLSTGIDVNIKFRRIDDFEFTRECAIFDLLDIPLYHGWIVDPQDHETASAIGSNSYNTLMGELVALETQNMNSDHENTPEDDSVDFAAATTAALGVPSPCLSRGRSFDDASVPVPEHHSSSPVPIPEKPRKGDLQEEAELMKVLKLSEAEAVNLSVDNVSMDEASSSINSQVSLYDRSSDPNAHAEAKEVKITDRSIETSEHEASLNDDSRALCMNNNDQGCNETSTEEAVCSSGKRDQENSVLQSTSEESTVIVEKPGFVSHSKYESTLSESREEFSSASESYRHVSTSDEVPSQSSTVADARDLGNKQDGSDRLAPSCSLPDSKSSSDRKGKVDEPEALTSTIDGNEPLYEGEECILESGTTSYENREPIYEGEVVLSEQVDNGSTACNPNSRSEMTQKQGGLVRNFLKNSASQLTIYGLFCLQDGIKERELCVFFRNNHFNTMFKFEGELYILVTDQGYINQPDLVWEKLNEVNGDTLYMTGNFKEFKVDSHANSTWDEQNAVASTADYLAKYENSAQEHSTFNSDLQLAIALQQQEFEQQQTQRNNNLQQETASGSSRLVTGPQVPRNSAKPTSSSFKQELKASKDKCTVM